MKKPINDYNSVVEYLKKEGFIEVKGEEKRKAIAKIKREERTLSNTKRVKKRV